MRQLAATIALTSTLMTPAVERFATGPLHPRGLGPSATPDIKGPANGADDGNEARKNDPLSWLRKAARRQRSPLSRARADLRAHADRRVAGPSDNAARDTRLLHRSAARSRRLRRRLQGRAAR